MLKRIIAVAFLSMTVATVVFAAPAPAPRAAKADKGKPAGAADYVAEPRPGDGANMVLAVEKLEHGFDPPRPFLIWAIGSSYTNMLGNGDELAELIRRRFPHAPEIVYKKMVGNSAPFQYIRGWAHHLVMPDQPDVVLIYTIGKLEDLEQLIIDLRRGTTADIIVPSIHWRERGKPNWGTSEDAPDQEVGRVREICQKYGVEFVDNRREWADYLKANNLEIEDLLKDAVHQSSYGATIINMNIARHFHRADNPAYDPRSRERRVTAGDEQIETPGWTLADDPPAVLRATKKGSRLKLSFTGNRIDLIGVSAADGGTAGVLIDGKPAEEIPAFVMTYIEPGKSNARNRTTPPRDSSPHAVWLGRNVVPQQWTITMTSDRGDFRLTGSITGTDGDGNSQRPFTSRSGQITIDPGLWRRPEANRTGDVFTFEVQRATVGSVSFRKEPSQPFRRRLVMNLPNGPHTVELVAQGDGTLSVAAFDIFQPPLE